MSSHGYSGASYDRWVERTDTSALQKMKETFWTTKQAVIQKLGKKEDEHVVASDQELDSKLEVFKAIQRSSMDLLRVIEKYQDRLCRLSQEENATGRFLKTQSNVDKTRAGKMMAAVGKSQSFAAQQRLSLRVPLVRLYQEVETFRYRAISDTLMTINRMEGARTEYRGALLWMKAVSEELDPDMYKQLEKFRKVQGQVRKTKAKFDKLKLDVMQKVDLLAASRCNMFSHVLANYQSTLLHFWEKTSRTMTAVAESFKGYQYYEFNIIKELAEPSKKLAEDTNRTEPAERDTDDDFDPSKCDKHTDGRVEEQDVSEQKSEKQSEQISEPQSEQIFEPEPETEERLIAFDDEEGEKDEEKQKNGSLQNLYESEGDENKKGETTEKSLKQESSSPFIEFDEDSTGSQKEEFDFSGKILSSDNITQLKKKEDRLPGDLLSEDLNLEPDDTEKDDMTILNEILNAPSTGEDDFSKEWQAVFGNTPLTAGTKYTPVESDQSSQSAEFMPSNLLDLNKQMSGISIQQELSGMPMLPAGTGQSLMGPMGSNPPGASPTHQSQKQTQPAPKQKPQVKKGQKSDMSAWFNLFADLDPLSNPDAIGKKVDDMTDA